MHTFECGRITSEARTTSFLRVFVALASAGVLMVVALTAGAATADLEWVSGVGGAGTDGGEALAADSAGNVYVTGRFAGTVDFDPGPGSTNFTSVSPTGDIFVMKLDADGNLVWARSMGGPFFSMGRGIAVDSAGNVYITGYFNATVDFDPGPGEFNLTSPNAADVFVLKLNSNGNFVFAVRMGGASTAIGNDVKVDTAGNVYVTGYFEGTADFNPAGGGFEITSDGNTDGFVAKLEPTGIFLWANSFASVANVEANGIAVDPSAEVLVTGFFEGTTDFNPAGTPFTHTSEGEADIFVVKFDTAGGIIWSKAMGGAEIDKGLAVATDFDGNVYTTGSFMTSADFDPGAGVLTLTGNGSSNQFIQKLDSSGAIQWAKALDGISFHAGDAVVVDRAGDVYNAGRVIGTVDYDPGPDSFTIALNSFTIDTYVQKLDADGNFIWAVTAAGPGFDPANGLAVDAGENVIVTGQFAESTDFDPGPGAFQLNSTGDADIFVLKLKQDEPVPATLKGRIKDVESGNPISCAAVELTLQGGGDRVVAVTDANGVYFFEPLPGGTYDVRVVAPGYATLEPSPIPLSEGGETIQSFTLMPRSEGPVVDGQVTDADTGEPLVGVLVQLFIEQNFYADTHTCADGRYELPLPEVKGVMTNIEAEFSLPNFQTAMAEQTIDPAVGTTIDETMEKAIIGVSSLAGLVRGDTGSGYAPVEGAQITLRGPINVSGESDADGVYLISALIGGRYTITASAPGFDGGSLIREIPSGTVSDASFDLGVVGPLVPGDVNGDDTVNAVDVQLAINGALGLAIDPGFNADLNGDGDINAIDVQLATNAALGLAI